MVAFLSHLLARPSGLRHGIAHATGEPRTAGCELGPSLGSDTTLRNELRHSTSPLWASVPLGPKESFDFDNHNIYMDQMHLTVN